MSCWPRAQDPRGGTVPSCSPAERRAKEACLPPPPPGRCEALGPSPPRIWGPPGPRHPEEPQRSGAGQGAPVNVHVQPDRVTGRGAGPLRPDSALLLYRPCRGPHLGPLGGGCQAGRQGTRAREGWSQEAEDPSGHKVLAAQPLLARAREPDRLARGLRVARGRHLLLSSWEEELPRCGLG